MTTEFMPTVATTLGAGILGGGFMAQVHSRGIRQAGGDLQAIATSSPASAQQAAQRLGIDHARDGVAELIAESGVDVVHVCTPNSTHAGFAEAALIAGKHVICEKPLATNAADARRLVELAEQHGLTGTVPFVYRYHPMVRQARDRVRQGLLGTLLSLQGSYLQDWLIGREDDNWRVDTALGGPSRAFADIGSHLVDLIEFVSGDRIVRVAGSTSTVFDRRGEHSDIRTEDVVALSVQLAGGAVGTLLISQVAAGRKNRLHFELSGSAEALEFNQEQPETLWVGRRDGNLLLTRDVNQMSPDAARLSIVPAGHPQGYQDAFNAFIADSYAAIRGEQPEGLPRFIDGLRSAVVTEAVLEAARTGGWVDVPATEGAQ